MGITAQELRIGNYINGSIGGDSELVLCSVTGYDPRDEFIFVSNDNNINYAEFVDFQPIPLTEEWLLKFGFDKLKTCSIFFSKIDFKVEYFLSKKSFFFYVNPEKNPIEIKYVHQLQNLFFSLCGEELTIKQLSKL